MKRGNLDNYQTTHVDVDFTYYGRKIRIGFDVEFTCEVSASGYINLNVNGNNLEVSLRQSSPFTPLSREIFEDTFNYIVERFDDMFKKLGMIIEEDQACSNIYVDDNGHVKFSFPLNFLKMKEEW